MLGVLEKQRKLGDGGGEAEVDARFLARHLRRSMRLFDENAPVAVRLLVAHLDRHQLTALRRLALLVLERIRPRAHLARARRDDLVERRHRVARTDFARVLLVVIKVLRGEAAVLVAQEPVALDLGRIELDLHLHVLRDGHERAAELVHHHLLRLEDGVKKGVVAVPGIRQLLHVRILVIAAPDAQHRQEDAAFALRRDEVLQLLRRRNADVEVAVRHENDAVVRLLVEVLLRFCIGALDAVAARRAAARVQFVDDGPDRLLLAPRDGRQSHRRAVRVGDDRDMVLVPQLLDQHLKPLFGHFESVVPLHRPRNVDEEREVARREILLLHGLRLHAEPQQPVLRVPRTRGELAVDRNWLVALRLRIIILEIVDELLDPHRGLRRQALLVVDRAPHQRIARRVHVQSECRKRLALRTHELILRKLGVSFGRRLRTAYDSRIAVHGRRRPASAHRPHPHWTPNQRDRGLFRRFHQNGLTVRYSIPEYLRHDRWDFDRNLNLWFLIGFIGPFKAINLTFEIAFKVPCKFGPIRHHPRRIGLDRRHPPITQHFFIPQSANATAEKQHRSNAPARAPAPSARPDLGGSIRQESPEVPARHRERPLVFPRRRVFRPRPRRNRRDRRGDLGDIFCRERLNHPAALDERLRRRDGIPKLEDSLANQHLPRRRGNREWRDRHDPVADLAAVFDDERDERTVHVGEDADLADLHRTVKALRPDPLLQPAKLRTAPRRRIKLPLFLEHLVHCAPPIFASVPSGRFCSQVSRSMRTKSGSSAPSVSFSSQRSAFIVFSRIA